ncbi:hypothetical protein ACFVTC_19425 [Streptomyces sp. NPDC057950]|uniref:hypothetical protein n=1 Tax=Streptomyces sp. NPDC057950 TaxID=3346288 RepID=UPI0036EB710F
MPHVHFRTLGVRGVRAAGGPPMASYLGRTARVGGRSAATEHEDSRGDERVPRSGCCSPGKIDRALVTAGGCPVPDR